MENKVSKTILEELSRYNQINNYIVEQDAALPPPPEGDEPGAVEPPPPAPDDTTLGGATPPEGEAAPDTASPIDIDNDPDVEEIETGDSEGGKNDKSDSGTEELDITELVTSQKDMQSKQEEYMNSMMSKLNDLETKLAQMDSIFEKINSIEDKVEKYRPKSAEEKLELRSLDSYPYNQKLSDFFAEKEPQMKQQGKEQYILTPDDVENYDKMSVRKSFDTGLQN
jgi:hypothetical protein